jgi:hypothetical protein
MFSRRTLAIWGFAATMAMIESQSLHAAQTVVVDFEVVQDNGMGGETTFTDQLVLNVNAITSEYGVLSHTFADVAFTVTGSTNAGIPGITVAQILSNTIDTTVVSSDVLRATITITTDPLFTEPSDLGIYAVVSRIDSVLNSGSVGFQSFLDATDGSVLNPVSDTEGDQESFSAARNSATFLLGNRTFIDFTKAVASDGPSGPIYQVSTEGFTEASFQEAFAIPEPGTIAMAFTAFPLICLGIYVRRRSRS